MEEQNFLKLRDNSVLGREQALLASSSSPYWTCTGVQLQTETTKDCNSIE
jgi:hypothetical protein